MTDGTFLGARSNSLSAAAGAAATSAAVVLWLWSFVTSIVLWPTLKVASGHISVVITRILTVALSSFVEATIGVVSEYGSTGPIASGVALASVVLRTGCRVTLLLFLTRRLRSWYYCVSI